MTSRPYDPKQLKKKKDKIDKTVFKTLKFRKKIIMLSYKLGNKWDGSYDWPIFFLEMPGPLLAGNPDRVLQALCAKEMPRWLELTDQRHEKRLHFERALKTTEHSPESSAKFWSHEKQYQMEERKD